MSWTAAHHPTQRRPLNQQPGPGPWCPLPQAGPFPTLCGEKQQTWENGKKSKTYPSYIMSYELIQGLGPRLSLPSLSPLRRPGSSCLVLASPALPPLQNEMVTTGRLGRARSPAPSTSELAHLLAPWGAVPIPTLACMASMTPAPDGQIWASPDIMTIQARCMTRQASDLG